MRVDRPLIGAVIFLGAGLALILGYCQGNSGFNLAYPFTGSILHLDITTTGPAVAGGVLCMALGALLFVWALFAALVSLFTFTERTRDRIVERYSITPRPDTPVYHEEASETETEQEQEKPEHFWSRPARTRI